MSELRNYPSERRFLTAESVVLGGLFGALLIAQAIKQISSGAHIFHSSIEETLVTAVALLMIVAYSDFALPILFANKPRLAIFATIVLIGHLSLVADSFALILILARVPMSQFNEENHYRFNAFAVKCLAALSALTVGSAFSIGELYSLPHYIASGVSDFAGLPMLVVLTPFSMILGLTGAIFFPVRFEASTFDSYQLRAGIKLAGLLILIIVTHNPFLAIGLILLVSALTGRTTFVVKHIFDEVKEGGATALGLIGIVILMETVVPDLVHWLQQNAHGVNITFMAAISSPFAGALLEPAASMPEFYSNISHLMLGAPMLVSSSLVAIIVFRNTISYEDLPPLLQAVPGIRHGGVYQEAVAYTVLLTPFVLLLALLLHFGNNVGLFISIYNLFGG